MVRVIVMVTVMVMIVGHNMALMMAVMIMMMTMITMMLMMMMMIPATRTKSIRGSEEDDASDEDPVYERLVSRRRCPTPTGETRLR